MARSSKRLLTFSSWLLASVSLIVVSCFVLNCLVDPLWYLSGNKLTEINYPFNERLAKLNRFLPRLKDYDCVIFGTSRATLLPEDKAEGYRCFNLALSDGQVSEYVLYADYLIRRGYAPRLMIVDIRRDDMIGAVNAPEVPDFVAAGDPPPSIFATYLSLDALNFSIRTLRGDAPHHRYYDQDFHARLEVRSKRRYYNPLVPITPQPPPIELHPERAALYIQLRQKFPMARAIAYLPPESAWRVAAFGLTEAFDPYLALIGKIAASYDRFLDFSFPSALTESKAPADTYDGSHYSREANERVLAALLAGKSELAVDWGVDDAATITARYHRRIAQFIAKTTSGKEGTIR
jgi:hypothetical protein